MPGRGNPAPPLPQAHLRLLPPPAVGNDPPVDATGRGGRHPPVPRGGGTLHDPSPRVARAIRRRSRVRPSSSRNYTGAGDDFAERLSAAIGRTRPPRCPRDSVGTGPEAGSSREATRSPAWYSGRPPDSGTETTSGSPASGRGSGSDRCSWAAVRSHRRTRRSPIGRSRSPERRQRPCPNSGSERPNGSSERKGLFVIKGEAGELDGPDRLAESLPHPRPSSSYKGASSATARPSTPRWNTGWPRASTSPETRRATCSPDSASGSVLPKSASPSPCSPSAVTNPPSPSLQCRGRVVEQSLNDALVSRCSTMTFGRTSKSTYGAGG